MELPGHKRGRSPSDPVIVESSQPPPKRPEPPTPERLVTLLRAEGSDVAVATLLRRHGCHLESVVLEANNEPGVPATRVGLCRDFAHPDWPPGLLLRAEVMFQAVVGPGPNPVPVLAMAPTRVTLVCDSDEPVPSTPPSQQGAQ